MPGGVAIDSTINKIKLKDIVVEFYKKANFWAYGGPKIWLFSLKMTTEWSEKYLIGSGFPKNVGFKKKLAF